jgi:uncharacterized protein (DUF2267 family)
MDQLVQQITQRTGISENQARQAVQMVGNFLKQKLPGPMASQVDNALGTQSAGGQSQGGFMGQSREHLGNIGDQPR